MANPTFVAAGAAIGVPGNNSVANVEKPAGVASGDLLLLVMFLGNATTNTPSPPSGFTLINNVATSLFSAGLYAYYKIAGGSEPSTYAVSQSGSNLGAARMYAWTGTHATTPINVNAKSAALSGVTTINLPSVTTTEADCRHIGIAFEYNGRTPTLSATGSQTARGGSTLGGRVFQVTDEALGAAGAVTGRTQSSGTSGDFYAFSIAIAPSGGASPVQQDLSASYTVTGSVQKDLAASYAIDDSVQTDLAASYGIASAVQQDLAVSYNILGPAGVALNVDPDHVLRNNTGSIWANTEFKLSFSRADTDAFVVNKTVTTDADGLLGVVTDAALTDGVEYDIKIKRTSDPTVKGLFTATAEA